MYSFVKLRKMALLFIMQYHAFNITQWLNQHEHSFTLDLSYNIFSESPQNCVSKCDSVWSWKFYHRTLEESVALNLIVLQFLITATWRNETLLTLMKMLNFKRNEYKEIVFSEKRKAENSTQRGRARRTRCNSYLYRVHRANKAFFILLPLLPAVWLAILHLLLMTKKTQPKGFVGFFFPRSAHSFFYSNWALATQLDVLLRFPPATSAKHVCQLFLPLMFNVLFNGTVIVLWRSRSRYVFVSFPFP